MKANELRIGNWVNALMVKEPLQVDLMAISQAESCEPILLTEQWLKDSDIRDETNSYSKGHPYFCPQRDILVQFFKNGRIDVRISGHKFTFKKGKLHIHQLQNLYFALKGEELKWKKE